MYEESKTGTVVKSWLIDLCVLFTTAARASNTAAAAAAAACFCLEVCVCMFCSVSANADNYLFGLWDHDTLWHFC